MLAKLQQNEPEIVIDNFINMIVENAASDVLQNDMAEFGQPYMFNVHGTVEIALRQGLEEQKRFVKHLPKQNKRKEDIRDIASQFYGIDIHEEVLNRTYNQLFEMIDYWGYE